MKADKLKIQNYSKETINSNPNKAIDEYKKNIIKKRKAFYTSISRAIITDNNIDKKDIASKRYKKIINNKINLDLNNKLNNCLDILNGSTKECRNIFKNRSQLKEVPEDIEEFKVFYAEKNQNTLSELDEKTTHNIDVIHQIIEIKEWVEKTMDVTLFTLPVNNKKHKLEKEIEELIKKASNNMLNTPSYKRRKRGEKPSTKTWETPLEYLEDIYGKFLAKNTLTKKNYLYQYQLKRIDPKFFNTLKIYLKRNPEQGKINDFLPAKKEKNIKEAESIVSLNTDIINKLHYMKYK